MESPDHFLRPFLDACFAGELSKTQEAIGTGRLAAEDLDSGLKLATHMAHPDIVAALFDAGATVSASTATFLPGKDLQQHASVVRYFLDHGLDPNWRFSSGEPLLPFLINPACARELLSRGADPNLCGPKGTPPLGRAIVSTREGDLSLLELYLAYGAMLEPRLLFYAVAPRVHQGELMTRFLLGKGLDPNVTSEEWGTPLHRAAYAAKPDIVKLLLDAGADPTAISVGRKYYGKSPAQVAERVRHPDSTPGTPRGQWMVALLSGATFAAYVSEPRNASLGFIRFERNATAGLGKRMELPLHDIGVFYENELPRVTEPIVPHEEAPSAADMSTAVMKTFGSVKRRQQYSTGTAHLSGCTTMYLISRKGVYATRWWENVSFSPDDEWRDPGDRTDEEMFQATVLDMLTTGGNYHPKLDADLIEDDFIRAYLIHPTTTYHEGPGDVGYPDQWEAIRTTVGELVPTLQDASRWTDIPYKALDDDDDVLNADAGTAGKNLFKYDPMHTFESGQKGPLAMLWAESEITPYHQDEW
ncbi:hypothetical protein PHISP_08363 [Aspergillus sp. HF37]|nr:hypothetical protein PHISP_08363 [Aspergillus sp. HF37]